MDSTIKGMRPIHPGEILREEFLVPLAMTANALSIALQVPATRIGEIVNERRRVTADTALRLARYFGTTPDFWLSLQSDYDLAVTAPEVDVELLAIRPLPHDHLSPAVTAAVKATRAD